MLASGRWGSWVTDQLTLGENHQSKMIQEGACISWAGCPGFYSRLACSTTGFLKPVSFVPLDVFNRIPSPMEIVSLGGQGIPSWPCESPPSCNPLPPRASSHLSGTRVLARLSYSRPSSYFPCDYGTWPTILCQSMEKKKTCINRHPLLYRRAHPHLGQPSQCSQLPELQMRPVTVTVLVLQLLLGTLYINLPMLSIILDSLIFTSSMN